MTISERIFDLLAAQRKTQTSLAQAISVRISTVSSWKAKNCDPAANLIAPIAEFFGVSCDYLCTGTDYKPVSQNVNQGIFGNGNNGNVVAIGDGNAATVSEFECELLRVYNSIDPRRKNALLAYAYQLENQDGKE